MIPEIVVRSDLDFSDHPKPNIDWCLNFWRNTTDQNGKIFRIWKAYYDDRPTIGSHAIRILGTMDRNPAPSVKCIFWNSDDTMRIIQAKINPKFRPKYLLYHALQSILINVLFQNRIFLNQFH